MNASTAAYAGARLDVQRLTAAAEAATGLSDWGKDQTFRIGLEKLVKALNDLDAPDLLRQQAGMRMTGSLMTLLHFVEDEKLHPEILAERIERPVVIVGLPRTGTTVTYDLLALDPAARAPRNWEFAMPWPAPEIATWNTDPRIAQLDAIFEHLLRGAPKLADIQDIEARACSECNLAFTHHFASTQFPAEWGVISYGKWLRESYGARPLCGAQAFAAGTAVEGSARPLDAEVARTPVQHRRVARNLPRRLLGVDTSGSGQRLFLPLQHAE